LWYYDSTLDNFLFFSKISQKVTKKENSLITKIAWENKERKK